MVSADLLACRLDAAQLLSAQVSKAPQLQCDADYCFHFPIFHETNPRAHYSRISHAVS